MFKIIRIILNTLLLALANLVVYLILTDMSYLAYLIETLSSLIVYERTVQFLIVAFVLAFDFVILLSFVERLWAKRKTVKVKTKNGKIEISLTTIEDISKNFLETKNIIKTAKAKVKNSMCGTILNVDIENYKTDELNEKLANIKVELEKHILEMLGFKPKKINININKINNELAVENISTYNTVEETVKANVENVNID